MKELETRIIKIDVAAIRNTLVENGALKVKAENQINDIYDFEDGRLLAEKGYARIRTVSDILNNKEVIYITAKKMLSQGKFKEMEEYEFEVIGILNGDKYRNHNDVIGRSYTIIPEKTFMKIYEDVKSYKLSEFDYIRVYPSIITLNSFKDIDKFVEKIGELNEFGDRNYKYETALDAYYGFAGNLDTLSLNSDILFKFSFVVSILLTIFIVSLDLNRRKKEIGLLASLGESKVAIMVQLVLEYLIIIVFTMIIAAFVSNIISNQFIDKIDLNPEVSDIFNDKTLDYSDSISILNKAKLTIDFVDLIKICLIQTVVILFTIILSAIQIFTIKVRKIMIDE